MEEDNNEIKLYDENLEKQLLGCILIENKVLRYIEIDLTIESFYFEINKTIFQAIKELLQEDRQADEQTLFYTLSNKNFITINDEELKKYIQNLITFGAGSISTPKEMCNILNYLTLKRSLSFYNKEINDVLISSSISDIDEKIATLEQKIYNITSNTKNKSSNYFQIARYTKVLEDKLKKARKSEKTILGVRTGLTDIDNYTGGLQKGDLIIIAARPSMGKTALATTIAKNIAEIIRKESYNNKRKNENEENEEPKSVAIFSLEMSGEQLAARIVAMDSKFNTKTIHTGRYDEKDRNTGEVIEANKKINDNEWAKIYESMQDISELPLYIDDTPALNISILRSRARYMKNRYNICAIIIDYLQLLRPSKGLGGQRVLEIAEITSSLKAIAKELDIPVIALSQLSRAVESSERKDKRPQLSDLRESGTIEQDADIVMLLYREEYYLSRQEPKITDINDDIQANEHTKWLQKYEKIKNLAEVIVAKNRNGPVGTIMLSFDREHMIFSGYEPNRDNYNYAGNIPINKSVNNNGFIQSNNQKLIEQQNKTSIKEENYSNQNDFTNNTESDDLPDDLKAIFE